MNTKQWTTFGILTFLWGSSFLWIKLAVQETGPMTLVTLRLLFGIGTLLVFILREKSPLPKEMKTWVAFIIQGFVAMVIPWTLIFWAQQTIDSTVASVLDSTVPLFTIVLAHLFLKDDRMTRDRILGLILGFLGIVVLMHQDLFKLISAGGSGSNRMLLGQIAVLLASAFYGIANVYARAKFRDVPPVLQAFFPMLLADVVMWGITPFIESPFALPTRTITWISVAWLGIFGAGICWLLFYRLLHAIGPTRVSMVAYTIPVVGVTLGVVFLKEPLGWPLVAGTLVVVSGVWLANRTPKSGGGNTGASNAAP